MKSTFLDNLLEKNLLPDFLIRIGIRHLNRVRIREESGNTIEERQAKFMRLIATLRDSPVAVHTKEANEQHYEVPARFFELVLGKHRKYSSAFWPEGVDSLDAAEEAMLGMTAERSEIQDGEDVLEIGCGWGSLTLYLARKFPLCKITAVSNSNSQREFITHKLAEAGLKNVRVITADINSFDTQDRFDRIVSVEMFEHARNYDHLFRKMHKFLKPNGTMFLHVFTHRELAYLFEPKDAADWMSRYFFTGGTMPSNQLFLYFSSPFFTLDDHWVVSGTHYAKTSEAWLRNMDHNKLEVLELFKDVYQAESRKWFIYWRIFFLAVAELFDTNRGQEWMVNHYRFRKAGAHMEPG